MNYNYTTDVEYEYLFKILIIGDSGVGKTAILQRFAQDYFATDYVATIGVDFQIKTIDADRKRCKLQVWDTAGQDRFKCVVSSFYRGAHGVMICFDITDLDTFRNVDNWLEEIKRYCPEQTPVFLVGTKSDLQTRRMVHYPMIKTYCEKMNLTYIETSSKTSENVEKCFSDFTCRLVQHHDQLSSLRLSRDGQKKTIDLDQKGKRVQTNVSSGCFGKDTCTI